MWQCNCIVQAYDTYYTVLIKFAVIFLRPVTPVTDISAKVAPMWPIGVKFCIMAHIGPGQVFSPFGGGSPGIPKSEMLGINVGHLTANISKKNHGALAPQGVHYKQKYEKIWETGRRCCTYLTAPPPRMAGLCLADALVFVLYNAYFNIGFTVSVHLSTDNAQHLRCLNHH